MEKPKICRVGQQACNLRRANVAIQVQRPSAAGFPLFGGGSVFCCIQAFN